MRIFSREAISSLQGGRDLAYDEIRSDYLKTFSKAVTAEYHPSYEEVYCKQRLRIRRRDLFQSRVARWQTDRDRSHSQHRCSPPRCDAGLANRAFDVLPDRS